MFLQEVAKEEGVIALAGMWALLCNPDRAHMGEVCACVWSVCLFVFGSGWHPIGSIILATTEIAEVGPLPTAG